jgi:hypothetical protein
MGAFWAVEMFEKCSFRDYAFFAYEGPAVFGKHDFYGVRNGITQNVCLNNLISSHHTLI